MLQQGRGTPLLKLTPLNFFLDHYIDNLVFICIPVIPAGLQIQALPGKFRDTLI